MYLLIKPFHHGQGHGLAQIVPAERHHEHVSLGFPFPGGDLALFYHGHVTLVVKEDHLEFVKVIIEKSCGEGLDEFR